MRYLKLRGKVYYYQRRIPKKLVHLYNQMFVVKSLETDSPKIAEQRCNIFNKEVEDYWNKIIQDNTKYSDKDFTAIIELAAHTGFTYQSIKELKNAPLAELINRLNVVPQLTEKPEYIEAILGSTTIPSMTWTQALERLWDITKDETMMKSPDQIRKWKNVYKKAVKNFVKLNGNIPITETTRDHVLILRDWWIERIKLEDRANNTANKEMFCLKKVIQDVNEHHKLGIDVNHLFSNVTLKKKQKSTRKPFETDFIQNHLLAHQHHENVIEEAKYMLYAIADTGCRPSEIVGLRAEDIILNTKVPHIKIRPYLGHELKTKVSERDIPLVGCALWAFTNCPNGFWHYRNMKNGATSFSATMNAHLRRRNLLPTKDHTVYSLRHSFQDRITNLGVTERIDKELMGHSLNRVEYGDGGTLERKQEWLLQMCFEPPKV